MTRDEIKKELERLNKLAEQRTPGEWEAGIHPANAKINVVRPVMFAKYTGKLPDCEGGAVFFRNKADAELLAAVPVLLSICNTLAAELKAVETPNIPVFERGGGFLKAFEAAQTQQACSVVEERQLRKYQECGCVVCSCEDEEQCQGCGAKHCGNHPVGKFPTPSFRGQARAAQSEAKPKLEIALEALQFYAEHWQGNMEGDRSTPGLSRCWMEPTDDLWDDAGRKAKAAIEALSLNGKKE